MRRFLIITLLLALVTLAGVLLVAGVVGLFCPSHAQAATPASSASPLDYTGDFSIHHFTFAAPSPACGSERWPVKTLMDREAASVNLAARATSVETLVALGAPAYSEVNLRAPLEKRAWSVNAWVIAYKLEKDSDFHVVVKGASGKTMIVEFTNPACAAGSRVLSQMTRARKQFLRLFAQPTPTIKWLKTKPVPVTIVGVGFFDKRHGQTGLAPNGVELHPVLSITSRIP